MQKSMFPHAVDATMLSAFRSCPQKMFRTYIEHWKPQAESVHLVAGGAFAKGLEVARSAYYTGEAEMGIIENDPVTGERKTKWYTAQDEGYIENAPDCVALGLQAVMVAYGDFECPADSAKSLERTCGAFEFYFDNYPLGQDGMEPLLLANGKRAIEFSFAEPLPVNHPITGNPLLWTGRSDMIANFAGGIYIEDDKTTSSLGASWSRQWEHRSQFTGYSWAARQIGLHTDGIIVRGVSILKTKYDTMQVLTNRSQYEIDRWLEQTCRDLERMKQAWADGYWDFNLDHSCAEYGGCSMVNVCKSDSPDSWLPMYFEKRVWDPLLRKELSVEDYEKSWNEEAGLAGANSSTIMIP